MSFLLSVLFALPSHAGDFSVAGPLVREDTARPGQAVEGTILVRNDGDAPQELVVYRRDHLTQADGTEAFLEPATTARSNAAWVDLSRSQLTLAPHVTERVRYRIEVPLDAALTGTYWSVLVVEPAAVEPLDVTTAEQGVSTQTIVHYAIEVVTHVGAPEPALLALDHGVLLPSGSPAGHGGRMSVDVRNAGTSLLAPRVWVELFDARGEKAGRFVARSRPGLFPGCSARYAIDLSRVAPGSYTALTVADAGRNAVFGAEYPIELH